MEERIKAYFRKIQGHDPANRDEQEFFYELEAHMLDLYEGYCEAGYEEQDAIERVLLDMGEPEPLSGKEKRRKHPRIFAVWFCLLGISILCFYGNRIYQAAHGKEAYLLWDVMFLIFGLLLILCFPVGHLQLRSKQIYRVLQLLTGIDFLLTWGFLDFYGRVAVDYKIVLAAVYLYLFIRLLSDAEYREPEKRRKVLLLMGAVLLLTCFSQRKAAVIFLLVGYIFLTLEFWKNGAGKRIGILLLVLVLAASLTYAVRYAVGEPYERTRLELMVQLKRGEELEALQRQAGESFLQASFTGKEETAAERDMGEGRDYYLSYLAGQLGVWAVVLLLALYLGFLRIMWKRVQYYEKERVYGKLILCILGFRIFYALLMNVNLVPGTSINIPMLTYEPWMYFFDCITLGYLLHTFLYVRRLQPLHRC